MIPLAHVLAIIAAMLCTWILGALVTAHASRDAWLQPFSVVTRDRGERSLGRLMTPVMLLLLVVLFTSVLLHDWALTLSVILAGILSIALHERPLLPKGNSWKENQAHLLYAAALFGVLTLIAFFYSPFWLGKATLLGTLILYLCLIFLGKGWRVGIIQKGLILTCMLNIVAFIWVIPAYL